MKEYFRVQANIDLDAIYTNLATIKKQIKDGTKLMAVIKADGYGHGAVPIAKAVDHLVDAYGIAIVEEGIPLRKSGISKPLLILGFSPAAMYQQIIQYQLTQTVFQYNMAKQLSDEAVRLNQNAKIHIKLDTGMSRIGFKDNEESFYEILKISQLPNIEITGMFTHFACADILDKTSSQLQMKRFMAFAHKLEEGGIQIPTKHISNSAGIIDMSEANLDMVRSGITTYGLYPSDEVQKNNLLLTPAMEIKTNVVFVKEVEAGVGIGYGSSFVTTRQTKVATIPVGYADGYPRALSNKGRVLIHGQSAPIIGRVCMDQFMVDVSHIEQVKEGDVVTLVGRDQRELITVEELAEMSYSFNYEFVCNISKRVPRVYYRHGKCVGTMDYYDCLEETLELDDNMLS